MPPATAAVDPLILEAKKLSTLGISSLVLLPPYARSSWSQFPKGLENPEGELRFWDINAKEICNSIESYRKSVTRPLQIIVLGKNLGGTMGAYVATKCSIHHLIVFGSVPSLSYFWQHSEHPKAKA